MEMNQAEQEILVLEKERLEREKREKREKEEFEKI